MTRVFIISATRLYRDGLADMLARDGRFAVAGTAASATSLLNGTIEAGIDVALVDIAAPDTLACLREVALRDQAIKTIALGISGSSEQVITCAESGVAGYVCRDSSFEELLQAITSAVRGELHCPPGIAAALLGRVGQLATRKGVGEDIVLTPRQEEVARLLGRGLTNQEIGDRLHIEVSTVKIHLHNMFDKLGVKSRAQAVARMRDLGLLRLSDSTAA